ncbi:MAG TPA: CDP-diacylglycerol--glycerol-3-phosphate 3-phosphatidyltransferase [Acidimicrobiia bacterium]|nr:CDP-diacylglycerol--glycerol-3-phosphate 3-phosphatidyltransferase [Acidimicrobiia bacterium]
MPSPARRTTLSIPDRIAYFRMALVPVILTLILLSEHIDNSLGIAAALMGLAIFSDFLDGYLARRWKITTVFGAFLDQITDKVLVAGALFGLVAIGRVWAWAAFVIVAREILVSGLRGLAAMDGEVVHASIWGKIKASAQYLAIMMALIRTETVYGGLRPDQWVMVGAVVVTALSGYEYFTRFARVLRASRTGR